MATVTYEYKFPSDFRPAYVNGAYGGVSPQGEIAINFFLEQLPPATADSFEVKISGQTAQLGDPIPKAEDPAKRILDRWIQVGVLMNLDCAKRIHTFLGNTIQSIEDAMKGNR